MAFCPLTMKECPEKNHGVIGCRWWVDFINNCAIVTIAMKAETIVKELHNQKE